MTPAMSIAFPAQALSTLNAQSAATLLITQQELLLSCKPTKIDILQLVSYNFAPMASIFRPLCQISVFLAMVLACCVSKSRQTAQSVSLGFSFMSPLTFVLPYAPSISSITTHSLLIITTARNVNPGAMNAMGRPSIIVSLAKL